MMQAVKILPHYTYEDYCQWEGRWEIIEGIPYAMSPAPTMKHQWISANIKYELKAALKKAGCKKCKVYDFIDFKISEDTLVQPDATVVCKETEKDFLDFTPNLVVEILSPSTAMKDRNNKFLLYQAQKIPYYIIIDPDKETIEIYHLKDDGKYALEKNTATYTFQLEKNCQAKVMLKKIWQ